MVGGAEFKFCPESKRQLGVRRKANDESKVLSLKCIGIGVMKLLETKSRIQGRGWDGWIEDRDRVKVFVSGSFGNGVTSLRHPLTFNANFAIAILIFVILISLAPHPFIVI